MVLSREKVTSLLGQLRGPVWLMASLMYGAGLRLLERAQLRVKDLHFHRGELTRRQGWQGSRDDAAGSVESSATRSPARVKTQHDSDLALGRGSIALPRALRAKYPNAPREWGGGRDRDRRL